MMPYKKIVALIVTVLVNVFFWIGVYFFYTYFLGYGSSNTSYVNQFSAYLMPVSIILSYFVIFYLIPNYLRKRRYQLFFLYGAYTIIVSFTAIILSVFFGLVFSSYLKDVNTVVLTRSLPLIILGVYFVVLIAVLISLLVYSYLSNLKNEDLKNKFLQTQLQLKEQELKFLKMQIHPHFLFNSLNTIYGLSLQKGEETPEMILKLSNLLDYILYQVQKPLVYLKDELNHIEDYIGLEKNRFPDSLKVNYEEFIDDDELQIAPMMLLPFVENAFKHGRHMNGILSIDMRVKLMNNTLDFYIENSAIKEIDTETGIGLNNIQKRLEMLYPEKFNLTANFVENCFKVHLQVYVK